MSRGSRQHRRFGRLAAVGGTFLILSSLLLSVGASAAIAADTGAKAPGATTSPNAWTGGGNALADDGTVATSSADNNDQGYRDFGLNIPNGSIIDGITVRAEAASTRLQRLSAPVPRVVERRLQLDRLPDDEPDRQRLDAVGRRRVRRLGPRLGSDPDDRRRVPPRDAQQRPRQQLHQRRDDVGRLGRPDGHVPNGQGRHGEPGALQGRLQQGRLQLHHRHVGLDRPAGRHPSNLPQLQAGITGFVDAFAAAGGDGIYSGTRFNGTSANTMTSGYDSAAAFKADVVGLTNPNGTTPTAAGINTGAGNDSGDRGDAPNVMFVVTDGSPNVPGGDLGDPPTWLQAANAAIDAADGARGDGYVVKAVYLSTAGDPGDTTLPFSSAGDAAWAKKVMQEIGGGSYLDADFKSFVKDLFEAIHCAPPPTVT